MERMLVLALRLAFWATVVGLVAIGLHAVSNESQGWAGVLGAVVLVGAIALIIERDEREGRRRDQPFVARRYDSDSV